MFRSCAPYPLCRQQRGASGTGFTFTGCLRLHPVLAKHAPQPPTPTPLQFVMYQLVQVTNLIPADALPRLGRLLLVLRPRAGALKRHEDALVLDLPWCGQQGRWDGEGGGGQHNQNIVCCT